MQGGITDEARRELSTVGAGTPVRREIEDLPRGLLWLWEAS